MMAAGTLTAGMSTWTPERLIEEARAFSQEAWAHIYDQHYESIHRYCYFRTGNHTIAEDLASEVFLEALRGIQRYRYRGVPFASWLYRIARNLTADFLKRRARRPTSPLGDETIDHPQLRTEDETETATLRQDMQAAIRRLKEEHQQVIILRFYEGLSHEETAAAMGRRPGAVRVLQHRALTALRQLMTA